MVFTDKTNEAKRQITSFKDAAKAVAFCCLPTHESMKAFRVEYSDCSTGKWDGISFDKVEELSLKKEAVIHQLSIWGIEEYTLQQCN